MRRICWLLCTGAVALIHAPALPRSSRPVLVGQLTRLNAVNLENDAGGLKYVSLTHPTGANAKVFLYGADVTSYVDADGTEWIAVRPDAKMDGSKPISGGLSHCFPQFGPVRDFASMSVTLPYQGEIQQHGFARNVDWSIIETGDSSVTFELKPSDDTRAIWDKPFACQFQVTVTASSLDTALTVTNAGMTDETFDFQAALHSYYDISSIGSIKIAGSFEGSSYLDKTANPPATFTEARKEITIAEEYDRVYLGVSDPVLKDEGKQKQLKIVNSQGFKDTVRRTSVMLIPKASRWEPVIHDQVVWNPYGNDSMGYSKFVCVESVAFEAVHLQPGENWVGAMQLVPEPM